VTVVPANIQVGLYALSIPSAACVNHPNWVMITISATSTFDGDEWPELKRAQLADERVAN
jgi:hypothetical protein